METNLLADNLGRASLDSYLGNPIPVKSPELSTLSTVSATSVSTGGITGKFIIKQTGSISVRDSTNVEVVKIDKDGIIISDGTVDLVTINKDGMVVNDGTLNLITIDKTGITVNDGTVDLVTINKDGITVNDGTDDRVVMGKF